MKTERPRLLVVDDDRAVLTLVGTGVTCLDVLKSLRSTSPQCEAVLTTGYTTLDALVEAVRRSLEEEHLPRPLAPPSRSGPHPEASVSLVDVEREHIIRTLQWVHGNKAVAARLLGISRRAFYRQLERHRLHQRIPLSRRGEAAPASTEHTP